MNSLHLLPSEVRAYIPPIRAAENNPDPIVWVKFFTPWSHWEWYVIEFDGNDYCFGWVKGDFPELGYFLLSELASVRGPLGVTIERDLSFEPCPLSKVRKRSVNTGKGA